MLIIFLNKAIPSKEGGGDHTDEVGVRLDFRGSELKE